MCRPLHRSFTAADDHSEEEKTVLMAPKIRATLIPRAAVETTPKTSGISTASTSKASGTATTSKAPGISTTSRMTDEHRINREPLIITLGLDNFESHPRANTSKLLADFIKEKRGGKSYNVNLDQDADIIEEAIRASRPKLFRGLRIVLIDCRSLNDPQAIKHIGTHPNILDACARHKSFNSIAETIGVGIKKAIDDDVPVCYVCVLQVWTTPKRRSQRGYFRVPRGHGRHLRLSASLGSRMAAENLRRKVRRLQA